MSLLHRQIAERARLNPNRGGMPWQVVTEPLTLLVSAVAGEMGSQPLAANVGAVFFMTTSEAIERGRPTNTGIQSLARDVHNQLVYADPTLLHERIAMLEANEEKYKDSGFKPGPDYLANKAKLIEASKELDKRAATLTPEKVKAEASYSESFFAFKNQWDAYYIDRVVEGKLSSSELAGNEVSKTIDDFDTQYREFHQKFKDLGYVPSMEPPQKSKVGDTFPDFPSIGKITADIGGIVKPLLIGGLLIGGGLLAVSLYRPSTSQPARAR